jgi:pimeloyl-ACP methyl ester carboxylesterase
MAEFLSIMTAAKSTGSRRLLKSVLRVSVLVYLGLCLFIAVDQRKLLYVPATFSVKRAQTWAAQKGLVPWTNAAGEIIGWRLAAPSPAVGSVLVAHGNGGSALGFAELAATIHSATGLNPYLLEYPGYGQRGGSPSETTLLAAADEAWQLLPTNHPAYVVSESLGTGIATHLAQKYPTQVAGLLLFVPYDRLASVAQAHYPWLPAYFLLWDRFAPIEWLASYHGPVEIIIAGNDQIIPPARGQNLYDSYQGPKTLQVIPGASHGGNTVQSPLWWRDVLAFWQANSVSPKPHN